MSLINKMLQDLEARSNQAGPSLLTEVRPVAGRERGIAPRTVWLGAAVLLTLFGAGLGWRLLHRPLVRAPVLLASAQPAMAQAAPARSAATVSPAAAAPAAIAQAQAPASPAFIFKPAARPPAPRDRARPVDQASKTALKSAHAEAKMPPKAIPVHIAAGGALAEVRTPLAEPGRQLSERQRAENAYRRALAALQDGRVTEAMTVLQQTLAIDPGHEAARETLIRLLLENQRQDDAMRELQVGLELDPRQPALAMMLARLQVEQGGPAVETLMRTLPSAAGNAEYQAFLAAVLQRGQRHKEAAAYYELALRGAPKNGVWWLGLGISLQAEQRLPDAREAFVRASASAGLTPELRAFIERKLQQLAP